MQLSVSQKAFMESHYITALHEARKFGADEELTGLAVDGLLKATVSENPAIVRACVRNVVVDSFRHRAVVSCGPLTTEPAAPQECHVDVQDTLAVVLGNDAPLADAAFLQGYTTREVAEQTGLSQATVSRRLQTCAARLRRAL